MPGCFVVGADGEVLVRGVGHDVGYSTGQGFDGASDFAGAVVADALPPFSILLVGDPESGVCGCQELCKRGSVGNNCLVCPSENDVLDSETLGSSALFGWFVGVFTNP